MAAAHIPAEPAHPIVVVAVDPTAAAVDAFAAQAVEKRIVGVRAARRDCIGLDCTGLRRGRIAVDVVWAGRRRIGRIRGAGEAVVGSRLGLRAWRCRIVGGTCRVVVADV